MLRQPGSSYENRRSMCLRKVKSLHDEEAKVVGHEGGRGRNGFHTGALTLETPDGRRFSCGSGLSAEDRRNPPAVGTVVTYRFTELMDNGYPRFPVYVGPRVDLDWAEVCAKYAPPAAHTHAAGTLRRDHSIMFTEPVLARALTLRVEALQAAEAPAEASAEGGAWASDGSEGGDTEAEESDAGNGSPRAREVLRQLEVGDGPAAADAAAAATPAGFVRSRSRAFAQEAGLDLDAARELLQEHDRARTV
mmetsp:Transcript_32955/g.99286  ORF Transcript_32955/g.99286 Transcript_32955/m.99286 type:complete len:249 (-) Transcript_32955:489-1235(-)